MARAIPTGAVLTGAGAGAFLLRSICISNTPALSDPGLSAAWRATLIDPDIALTVFVCTAIWFVIYWMRERQLRAHRRGLRALYSFSEEIISAQSPAQIVRSLSETLPKITGVSGIRLFLYNSRTETLDLQPPSPREEVITLPVNQPRGVPVCFRNRALLTIPDIRKSPIYDGDSSSPGSVMYVPMQAEDEILGVLEICHAEGMPRFSIDQQSAAQHLGNQVAIALKLIEQRSMREQLFHSEKLAAAGQLVSGVVNELQTPLESLATRAALLQERCEGEIEKQELDAIASESRRAADLVARLVSFTSTEQTQAKRVSMNRLVDSLIRFRQQEWELRGIKPTSHFGDGPLLVLASENQMEQVLLSLFVHAEQSMANAPEKKLLVTTRKIGHNARLEITWSCPGPEKIRERLFRENAEQPGGRGFAVCRGIVQSHGGDLRFSERAGEESRIELELPAAPETAEDYRIQPVTARKCKRQLTTLLLETETTIRRHLTTLLSSRGHRVIPASSGEQALDLIQRMRFDLVFCSIASSGVNWVELRTRIQHRIGGFVLLTDGGDPALREALKEEGGWPLRKPIDETEFGELLGELETKAAPRPVDIGKG